MIANAPSPAIRAMLEHGFNEEQDEDGNTPLHIAAMFKTRKLVQKVAALCTRTNVRNNVGMTPDISPLPQQRRGSCSPSLPYCE
jgi:ankyrin repeat protein